MGAYPESRTATLALQNWLCCPDRLVSWQLPPSLGLQCIHEDATVEETHLEANSVLGGGSSLWGRFCAFIPESRTSLISSLSEEVYSGAVEFLAPAATQHSLVWLPLSCGALSLHATSSERPSQTTFCKWEHPECSAIALCLCPL